LAYYYDLGGVELVIEGAIAIEDYWVVVVELEKWIEFEGSSPWVNS
jgi:hypothetical protein